MLQAYLFLLVNVFLLQFALSTPELSSVMPPMRHYRDIHPVESDVPFILCAVCKRSVRQLMAQMKVLKKTRPSELDYINLMKNLCDPLEDEGFWINELDIAEGDGILEVKRMGGPGHCEEDCKTIALACKTVVDAADSEIAEMLYLNRSGTTPDGICSKYPLTTLKGSCGTPYPAIPVSRRDLGSDFRPKTKANFEREQKAAEQLLYGDQGTTNTAEVNTPDEANTLGSSSSASGTDLPLNSAEDALPKEKTEL